MIYGPLLEPPGSSSAPEQQLFLSSLAHNTQTRLVGYCCFLSFSLSFVISLLLTFYIYIYICLSAYLSLVLACFHSFSLILSLPGLSLSLSLLSHSLVSLSLPLCQFVSHRQQRFFPVHFSPLIYNHTGEHDEDNADLGYWIDVRIIVYVVCFYLVYLPWILRLDWLIHIALVFFATAGQGVAI